MTASAHSPRIAIWGTFDVANFGDHLFPRIFEEEMLRRLPDARVQAFSPLGHLHPGPLDGGRVVEPLGEWRPDRLGWFAREYDLIAIGGGEIIHDHDDAYALYYETGVDEARRLRPSAFFIGGLGPELEETCPVAWHAVGVPFDFEPETAARIRSALEHRAYVCVRDETSHGRLVAAGVTREIAVVPDSALLVERVVTEHQLERRLAYLRAVDSYPAAEPPLVVQGSESLLPHVEEIARALTVTWAENGPVPVVLLETGPCHGDHEFAAALAARLTGPVYRMPSAATIEDIAAALLNARAFAGFSLHGNLLAFVRGLPSAILDLAPNGYSKLHSFATLADRERSLVQSPDQLVPALRHVLAANGPRGDLAGLVARVDAHFDALAELAVRSAARRDGAPGRVSARGGDEGLRRAFEGRGRRLLEQRLRLADEIESLERTVALRDARLVELEADVADGSARILELEMEATAAAARLAELEGAREQAADAQRRLVEAEGRLAAAEQHAAWTRSELERVLGSNVIRYTAPLRAVYGRLRRLVR